MRARIASLLVAACALLLPNAASAAQAVSVSPSQVAFGQRCVAAASEPVPVTVRNTGDQPLGISAVTITGTHAADFAVTGAGARTLAPGASFTASVSFTAQMPGDRSASLTIDSDASTSPDQVPLTGSGVTRSIDATPTKLSFGDQRTGTASDRLQIGIASTGSSPVTIKGLKVTGTNASDFTVTPPRNRIIQPGHDAQASVLFRPRGTGNRTATITIESDSCAGTTAVGVAGTGTAPRVKVSPAKVVFGLISPGSASQPLPMVISNVGRAPLRITDLTVTGAQSAEFRFGAFPDLPKVLGPGEEFPVNVTFAPAQVGERAALLVVVSDDPSSPSLSVPLAGNVAVAGSADPLASPSPSVSVAPSPSATPSTAKLATGRKSGGGGITDYLAVIVVVLLVGGTFAALFTIRRRRRVTV